ncbi:MAG: peptide chain release factor N(5)-glutamine methyltransferase [Firmicutes bacterium]|nr:peptide chain release factor N(5)-glutamine methyltransferase [Bacillota bacterium]
MKTVKQCLLEAKNVLKNSGAAEYALDAELFMMKATGLTKVQLFTKDMRILTKAEEEHFEKMVEKRKNKMPSQYIINECHFMDSVFYVNENVLIPRSDTETLIETVIEKAKMNKIEKIIDVGTGSGCIAISLVRCGILEAVGTDVSTKALSVAKKNSLSNGTNDKIRFVHSDLFENVGEEYEKYFDAVVSNPPYIETETVKTLMCEVRDYEPVLALDGGADGLNFYRKIASEGKRFIRNGGFVFFEIGYNQGNDVKSIMHENGFGEIEIIKDIAGLDRVVLGRKM